MQKHLYEVKPGERFTYGGIEWVALDVDAEVIALHSLFVRSNGADRTDHANGGAFGAVRQKALQSVYLSACHERR